MIGETILSHFAKHVFDRLSSAIVEEAKLALGVEKELRKILSNLSSIKAVLREAEKQQHTYETVRDWLEDLEDVVYDIDDLLDEIATEAAIQNKNNSSTYKQVRKMFSRSNPLVLRLSWAHQIKDVCEKLDLIEKKRIAFNFSTHETTGPLEESRETYARIVQSEILGRDRDRELLMNSILGCRNCKRLSVVPIVGFGGIGKTTLAKLIYNDVRIDENFDKKIWVHVPHKFNLKRILGPILGLATGEKNMVEFTVEQLRVKLNEALKDTRYFLVLDDWWNEDSTAWRSLQELLDVGAKGSTVVMTTRDLKVASMVRSIPEYRLSELSDETCLLIFKQLAFREGEEIQPSLLELAKKITELSRGLPLLVTTLGSLLRGETDERVWHRVIRKLQQGHEDILKVLKLSYDQLPSHLKRCFQICPIFQKGAVMDPSITVSIWMGLGFLPCEDPEEPLELIGRRCINELSSKSLFHDVKSTLTDELDDLRMHDFVYDLAKSEVGDELAIINCSTEEVSNRVRYIRLDEDDLSGKQLHERLLSKARKARLLMLYTLESPLSKAFLRSIISNVKCLRILDFGDCQFQKLPRTIGYMKHLRFLNLANNRQIKQLPDSICNLLNMQTLLLNGCSNLLELPADIGRLENLRYLTVTTLQAVLPNGIGLLKSLRTLWIVECPKLVFLPSSTENLENLDSLCIVDCKELNLGYESWSVKGLNSLRVLLIKGIPKLWGLAFLGCPAPINFIHHLMLAECKNLVRIDMVEHLICLRTLAISCCPLVRHYPRRFLAIEKLEMLEIEGCRCLTEGLTEIFSTLRIPKIVIDGVNISRDHRSSVLINHSNYSV